MRLTKTSVKTISPPAEGTTDHKRGYALTWDDELRGFGLLTTVKGVQSAVAQRPGIMIPQTAKHGKRSR